MVTNPVIPVAAALPVIAAILGIYIFITVRKKGRISDKAVSILRVAAVCALIFMINLRPMTKDYDADIETKNVDVLFVVDTTISMWAEDYDGNDPRMDGVIETADRIMTDLKGSSFALVRFDNRSRILAPFTQDKRSVKDAFDTIKAPDIWYANGTSLNAPYDDMKSLLESSDKKDDKTTVVFFMSDGEITGKESLESFAELGALVDGGAVLGFGTESGGKMSDSYGGFVYDYENGGSAVSRIDEANLRKIAGDLGVDYIHLTSPERVDSIVRYIKTSSSTGRSQGRAVLYNDTYYYYTAILLVLLLAEGYMLIRKGRL